MTPAGQTVAVPSAAPLRARLSWRLGRLLLLVLASGLAAFAVLCWALGAVSEIAPVEINLLLVGLIVLNLAPVVFEMAWRRFDPLDAKHLFLAYYFLLLTVNSAAVVWFHYRPNPTTASPVTSEALVVRSLAAMVCGLAAFVIGCHLPIGDWIGRRLPLLPRFNRGSVRLASWAGIALGVFALHRLMQSAGGVGAFLHNLSSWRTIGVLAGVGYLTFPVAVVAPACALLLMVQALPEAGRPMTWRALGACGLALLAIGPVFVLGFRGDLVPAILQVCAVWHYTRRRLHWRQLFLLGAGLFTFLVVYGAIRNTSGEDRSSVLAPVVAVVFRTPGFDTVERVVEHLEHDVAHRGWLPGLVESATILVPRAVWPGKPQPASLSFADDFFFDFFMARGDTITGVKSGVSPTVIGEALWVGGLPVVAVWGLLLGLVATAMVAWRERGEANRLHVFVYAIFMSWFALFAEAPQNTLNSFVMLGMLAVGLALVLTVRLYWGPRRRLV